MPENPAPARRHLLGVGAAIAAAAATVGPVSSAAATPQGANRARLAFAGDGTFRVVQFNDTQDNHRTDVRTI